MSQRQIDAEAIRHYARAQREAYQNEADFQHRNGGKGASREARLDWQGERPTVAQQVTAAREQADHWAEQARKARILPAGIGAAEIKALLELDDTDQAATLTAALADLRALVEVTARLRTDAYRRLLASGHSQTDIARMAGITKQAISRVL